MIRQTNLLVGVGLAGVTVCIVLWRYLKSKDEPPNKWRKVGVLSDLMCFPIKSCGVVRAPKMECTDLGLQIGWLRDRYLMVVNSKKEFLTARFYPRLVLIKPSAVENVLTLEAPDMEPLIIDLKSLEEENKIAAILWDDTINSIDCGDAAAKWVSEFILGEPSGARLVKFPKDYKLISRTKDPKIVGLGNSGAFPDLTSYNIMNASSVDDLNSKLENSVTSLQFRPNFVVEGAAPFEEDHWKWVKIGNIVFKAVKDCTRCILTTVDPETGVKHPNTEPLTTLKKYRIIPDNKQKYKPNTTRAVLGVHLVLKTPGTIYLGDTVMVA